MNQKNSGNEYESIISDRLPQEDSNEKTARICKNCQVVFPMEYNRCPKCALSTIIAFRK